VSSRLIFPFSAISSILPVDLGLSREYKYLQRMIVLHRPLVQSLTLVWMIYLDDLDDLVNLASLVSFRVYRLRRGCS
jgi:hypothetical protein